jgi:hypothetical protein
MPATPLKLTDKAQGIIDEAVVYKPNPYTGATGLLAQRVYVVRSDQEIVDIVQGGGAGGEGTLFFRIESA